MQEVTRLQQEVSQLRAKVSSLEVLVRASTETEPKVILDVGTRTIAPPSVGVYPFQVFCSSSSAGKVDVSLAPGLVEATVGGDSAVFSVQGLDMTVTEPRSFWLVGEREKYPNYGSVTDLAFRIESSSAVDPGQFGWVLSQFRSASSAKIVYAVPLAVVDPSATNEFLGLRQLSVGAVRIVDPIPPGAVVPWEVDPSAVSVVPYGWEPVEIEDPSGQGVFLCVKSGVLGMVPATVTGWPDMSAYGACSSCSGEPSVIEAAAPGLTADKWKTWVPQSLNRLCVGAFLLKL